MADFLQPNSNAGCSIIHCAQEEHRLYLANEGLSALLLRGRRSITARSVAAANSASATTWRFRR